MKQNIYFSKKKRKQEGNDNAPPKKEEKPPNLPVIKFEMKDENGTDIKPTSPIRMGKSISILPYVTVYLEIQAMIGLITHIPYLCRC